MIFKTFSVFHVCLLLLLPASVTASTGQALYQDNCAICHGTDGLGGVGIPLALPSFLEQVPDEYLHRTIRVGRPGRVMPPFYKLSADEINAIIGHIRSWSKKPAPAWDASPIKGNKTRGRILFNSHCSSCHGKEGKGGKGKGKGTVC